MKSEEYSKHAKDLGKLNRNSTVLLSSALSDTNQVFYADNLSSALSNTMDLSVRYVTQDQFHGMVVGDPQYAGLFETKTLYIVSSDEINAYNTRILNVAMPENDKDAANKWYVDHAAGTIDVDLQTLSNEVQRKLDRSEFTELNNAIGLSAATASNQVATKNDIVDFSDDVSTLSSKIVSISSNYALSNDVSALISSVSAAIECSTKSAVFLSSYAIGQVPVGGKLDKLNIIKFDSLETYHQNSNVIGLSDIVLIDEKQLNAEMSTIVSVATPIADTDAANKIYVDSQVSSISSGFKDKILASQAISSFLSSMQPNNGLDEVELQIAISALLDLVCILGGRT